MHRLAARTGLPYTGLPYTGLPRIGLPRIGLLLAVLLLVAACDSAEERAERHYQRGMALLAAEETDRALLEFRNVFRLDERHAGARLEYARALRDRGEVRAAVGQYQQLVDLHRASVAGHRELAELSLQIQDFETAETHAARAFALAPEDPAVRALKATIDFRGGAREEARAMAEAVLDELPDSVPAHMVLIAERMANGTPAEALARIDAALAAVPGDESLHLARLAVLEEIGAPEPIGAQLAAMAEAFPDNAGIGRALVAWHLRTGETAAAEAELRALAARTPDAPEGHLAVARFLHEIEGPDAARAELDRLAAGADDPRPYQRVRASLDFASGRRAEAIAALEALAADAPASDESRTLRVALAGMLLEEGRAADAAALVDAVLAEDAAHVEALKLRARRHVAADRPEAAIQDMRTALGQAPHDPEVMTIMAAAHEREGARELAAERLALAVEASGGAPAESLRYARFLMQEGRAGPAEGVVLDALRRAPRHPELVATLGRIHLERRDWPRVRQAAGLLRGLDDLAAAEAAAGLEMAALQAEGRGEDTVALLESLAAESPDALRYRLDLVRARLAAGDLAAAERDLAALLADEPDSLPVRAMQAGFHVMAGETAEAEALYRAMIEEAPGLAAPHQGLVALLAGLGRRDEARAALDAGLAATGGETSLRFTEAGLLEAEGDIDGAIAVYEDLYARDSADPVLANNLASLIGTHREDAASRERAFQIARRLRGTDVPQFQDTYGWLLTRRGEPAEGLRYLEPAARALPGDPLVQYHLGMTYLALERLEEAREALGRAVDVAGAASGLAQVEAARARIGEIDARLAAADDG